LAAQSPVEHEPPLQVEQLPLQDEQPTPQQDEQLEQQAVGP